MHENKGHGIKRNDSRFDVVRNVRVCDVTCTCSNDEKVHKQQLALNDNCLYYIIYCIYRQLFSFTVAYDTQICLIYSEVCCMSVYKCSLCISNCFALLCNNQKAPRANLGNCKSLLCRISEFNWIVFERTANRAVD